ncbi:MAG: DNA adenine methylase [Syntrophaceae bacterium]|nr:DNA adenine methylase [Syntrophaceae bacterium]
MPLLQEAQKIFIYPTEKKIHGNFQIQNRRFLGNKFKLLDFIGDIVKFKCGTVRSLCDIFAGTGVVGYRFNSRNVKIISNDILYSNYLPLRTFLKFQQINLGRLQDSIRCLNSLNPQKDNYFSTHFGDRYFTLDNARKIGAIREAIEEMTITMDEKAALITSLLYATDKVANTVGHYDAFRADLDMVQPLHLLTPEIKLECNLDNEVYQEDANSLIRKITCDVLYIDPPYNSRQYCDSYHLLENLATWDKPSVYGKAQKMDRSHLKSRYCMKSAPDAFEDLIQNADCKHILVSYNNTGETKDVRSNARIKDEEIVQILKKKGKVQTFERDYKAFTTGKSITNSHTERVFYCEVLKRI